MNDVVETLAAIAWGISVVSSAINAAFFAGYRDERGRHRIGAVVMAITSLAILMEGLTFGVVASIPNGLVAAWDTRWRLWLCARLLVGLGSVLLTLLILRQRLIR